MFGLFLILFSDTSRLWKCLFKHAHIQSHHVDAQKSLYAITPQLFGRFFKPHFDIVFVQLRPDERVFGTRGRAAQKSPSAKLYFVQRCPAVHGWIVRSA